MKVLLSRQSGLFICGTNAFNPLCANYTVSTECLKHACISHVQKHYFGKSPHPLVFYFPDVLAMFLGSVFSFSYLIYSLQPITFLTHILFHSPIAAFFIFFASKRHSTFQSSACSVVLNDSGFTGSPRISDPDGNLFKTPKQKESPLPFVYTLFFHLPGRQYSQKHQAVSDDLKSRELSLISLDAVFRAWLFIQKEW